MRTKLYAVETSGKRKGWFKKVVSVDQDCNNGYAFSGDFLQDGAEVDLSEGDVVIECRPKGSVKNGHKEGFAYRVEGDELKLKVGEEDDGYHWREDFLSFRDAVADLLKSESDTKFDDSQVETVIQTFALKIEIEYNPNLITREDAVDEVISEMDYKVAFESENARIKETEIVGEA